MLVLLLRDFNQKKSRALRMFLQSTESREIIYIGLAVPKSCEDMTPNECRDCADRCVVKVNPRDQSATCHDITSTRYYNCGLLLRKIAIDKLKVPQKASRTGVDIMLPVTEIMKQVGLVCNSDQYNQPALKNDLLELKREVEKIIENYSERPKKPTRLDRPEQSDPRLLFSNSGAKTPTRLTPSQRQNGPLRIAKAASCNSCIFSVQISVYSYVRL